MKIKNKLLGAAVSAAMAFTAVFGSLSGFSVLPRADSAVMTASAEGTVLEGTMSNRYYYRKVDSDRNGSYDTIRITGADSFITGISIPEKIAGLPVEAIGNNAFYNCMWLSRVTLPQTLKTIGSSAFCNCMSLTQLQIPDTVKTIGTYAFDGCMSLKSVTLPKQLSALKSYTFANCMSLSSIDLGSSMTSIGVGAFANCMNLSNITVPAAISSVGSMAFNSCVSLSDVYYGGSQQQWNRIKVGYGNYMLRYYAKLHFADERQPAVTTAVTTSAPVRTTTRATRITGRKTTAPVITTTRVTARTTKTVKTTVSARITTVRTTAASRTSSKPFEWGKDNWSFENVQNDFGHSYYYLNDEYADKLHSNVSNREWYRICQFRNSSQWGGSCYGMSALAVLARDGILPYSEYTRGADSLYGLQSPKQSSTIESLVNYYFMLQFRDEIQQQFLIVPYNSNRTNIQSIISGIDKDGEVLIGFEQKNWGGHAVEAYGYEYGRYTYGGRSYDGKINIMDPNYASSYSPMCCIYFSTSDYSWTIPMYSQINSESGAVFDMVISSPQTLNNGGCLAGTKSSETLNKYVASLRIAAAAADRTIEKISPGRSLKNTDTDIKEKDFYDLSGSSESTEGYVLEDADSGYRVIQSAPQEMSMEMDYENSAFNISADSGTEVFFEPSGYTELYGDDTDYTLDMIFDEGYSGSLYKMTVSGSSTDNVSLEKTDGGYMISADRLEGVTASSEIDGKDVSVEFSTSADKALITEDGKGGLEVLIDNDSNGTFETAITGNEAGDTAKLKGDVNGDGKVNVRDAALLAQLIASGQTDELSVDICDVNENGRIDVRDVAYIAKMVAFK